MPRIRPHAAALLAAAAPFIAAAPAAAQNEVTLSYQGRLDNTGSPFTGQADFTVQLFSERVGGISITQPLTIPAVEVEDGLFHLEIPYQPDRFNLNRDVWIELSIDGKPLRPRQRYIPPPKASQAGTAERSDDGSVVLFRSSLGQTVARNDPGTSSPSTMPSVWQTFEPTITGELSRLAIIAIPTPGDAVTYNLYEGPGTSGQLLATFDGNEFIPQLIEAVIDSPVLLQAGSTYTFEVEFNDSGTGLPSSGTFGLTADTYPGGQSSISRDNDIVFIVDVDTPGDAVIRVTPEAEVEIGGQLRVDGAFGTLDDDVLLPESSIEADEILDETGLASALTINTTLTSTSLTELESLSITAPGPGWVFASTSTELRLNHVAGTASSYTLGMSATPSSLPPRQNFRRTIPTTAASGSYEDAYTVNGVFRIPEAGTYTFFLLGFKTSAAAPDAVLFDTNLTLMYFPTSYGAVATSAVALPIVASPNPGPTDGSSQSLTDPIPLVTPPTYPPARENERIMREYHEALERSERDE